MTHFPNDFVSKTREIYFRWKYVIKQLTLASYDALTKFGESSISSNSYVSSVLYKFPMGIIHATTRCALKPKPIILINTALQLLLV